MATSLIAMTITSERETAQIVFGVFENRVRYWGRTTPDGTESKTRWNSGNIPAELWAGDGAQERRTTIATMADGWLKKVKKVEGEPLVLHGVHEIKMTPKDLQDLATAGQPNSLFTRVNRALKEPAVGKHEFATFDQMATWIVDGPLLALGEDEPLDKWTVSPLAVISSAATKTLTSVSNTDREKPIERTNGKKFYPYFFWKEKGLELTNVEFLQLHYPEHSDDVQMVSLVGPPGVGKSTLIDATFRERFDRLGVDFQRQCMITGNASTTSLDIIGTTWENPKTRLVEFVPGKAIFCAENGLPLFVDEADKIPEDELNCLLPLTDDRRVLPLPREYDYAGGAVIAKPGFGVIIGANDLNRLSSPFVSRSIPVKYVTNWELLGSLMGNKYEKVITWFRHMDIARENEQMEWSPQFREGVQMLEMVKRTGSTNMAIAALLNKFKLANDREFAESSLNAIMEVHIRPLTM